MNATMRNKHVGLKLAAGTLVVLLITCAGLLGAQTVVAEEATAALNAQISASATNDVEKTEVVYAKLPANGGLGNVYVVNTLEPTEAGVLTDYGTYSKVQNLTNALPLGNVDDAVTMDIAAEDVNKPFSYQGNLGASPLPWAVDVAYSLNGEPIEVTQVAGATGDLEIALSLTGAKEGDDKAFFDNYLVTATMTLAADKARNVEAPDAQIAMAGADTQLTFMVMPGKDAKYTVRAQVENFEMSSIQVAAIPFAIAFDFPDTNDLISQFTQLTDAIGSLESGAAALAVGAEGLASGIGQLSDGASSIAAGVAGVATGAQGVAEGLAQYQSALYGQAAQLNAQAEALGSETQLEEAYKQAMTNYVGAFAHGFVQAFPSAYSQAYAQEIAQGKDPETAARAAAETAANAASAAAQQAAASQEAALKQAITNIASRAGYAGSAQALQGAASGVGTAENQESLLGGAAAVASGATELSGGAWEFASGVGDAARGANEYAQGSSEFAQGMGEFKTQTHGLPDTIRREIDNLLAEYDKSDFVPRSYVSSRNTNVKLVQFVMSTEAITLPEKETPREDEPEQTPLDRLLGLFK